MKNGKGEIILDMIVYSNLKESPDKLVDFIKI